MGLTAACVVLGVWTGVRATAQGLAPPATPATPAAHATADTRPLVVLLRKPFTPTTLLAHVRHALSSEAGTRPRLAAG